MAFSRLRKAPAAGPKGKLPEIEGRRDIPRTTAHELSQETIAATAPLKP
jgi:hypothetical protein